MTIPHNQGSLKLTLACGILVAIAFQCVVTVEHHERKQRYLIPERVVKTNRPIIGQYSLVAYISLIVVYKLNLLMSEFSNDFNLSKASGNR